MTRLVQRPVADLLAAFAAHTPTPGGGSASALAGALGASLLAMVSGMDRTRGGPDDRGRLDAARTGLLHLMDHLTDLVDRDTRAYDAVVAAYRLPKETDGEKARRRDAVQSALRGAIEVPLDVMRACQAALGAAREVAAAGNPSAASDVGVAVELLGAGLRGAALNVETNLGGLKDEGFAGGVKNEVAHLRDSGARLAAEALAALS